MPIGRGGFGNHMEQQRERTIAAEDVEAQIEVECQQDSQLQRSAARPAEYAYRSRGGFGNIYSPKELAATGTFEAGPSDVSHAPDIPQAKSIASPVVRMGGRGGAGNFAYATAEAQKDAQQAKAEEDEQKRKIETEVAQDVENQLAFPAKVRTPEVKID